jgi:hypothetical protein
MATTALEHPAAERVDPIILEDAGDHVAQQLWVWLCKDRPETWLDEIAPLGKGKSSFEDMAAAWDAALEAASRDAARSQTAAQLGAKCTRMCWKLPSTVPAIALSRRRSAVIVTGPRANARTWSGKTSTR